MNVKRRGAVQVNRALRGEVTFGFAVRGTKKKRRERGEREAECRGGGGRGVKKQKTRREKVEERIGDKMVRWKWKGKKGKRSR